MEIKKILYIITFSIVSTVYGLNVEIRSGIIKKPNSDGEFSETNIGDKARVFYCLTEETSYQIYANNPEALYQARSDFESQFFKVSGSTTSDSSFNCEFEDIGSDGGTFYIIAIASYDSAEYNRSYYIARALSQEYTGDDPDFIPLSVTQAITGAGRWQVIYNEPPSITCTDLCVTGGVVSATYSISEFSRLNEIVSNEETSVIVAADLARTTQTNLAASVTATNSGESTFTFSFNPAEQNWTNSTLFIFGVEPPR